MIELLMIPVLAAVFFLLLYMFEEYHMTLFVLAIASLVIGLAFYQYIFWVAVFGIVLSLLMFFSYFIINKTED